MISTILGRAQSSLEEKLSKVLDFCLGKACSFVGGRRVRVPGFGFKGLGVLYLGASHNKQGPWECLAGLQKNYII